MSTVSSMKPSLVAAPSLDEIAADVGRIVNLAAEERTRIQLQCAAILAALATAPAAPTEDRDLTPEEAAERMHVGRSTIYEMLRTGRLRYVAKGKRGKLIPTSEIEEWKKRNLRCGPDQPYEAIRARVRNS